MFYVFDQLQEIFVTYKKEKTESEKALIEQSEKLQDQVTELRSENTKISTQLEFTSKRYPGIQSFGPCVFFFVVFPKCRIPDLSLWCVRQVWDAPG